MGFELAVHFGLIGVISSLIGFGITVFIWICSKLMHIRALKEPASILIVLLKCLRKVEKLLYIFGVSVFGLSAVMGIVLEVMQFFH